MACAPSLTTSDGAAAAAATVDIAMTDTRTGPHAVTSTTSSGTGSRLAQLDTVDCIVAYATKDKSSSLVEALASEFPDGVQNVMPIPTACELEARHQIQVTRRSDLLDAHITLEVPSPKVFTPALRDVGPSLFVRSSQHNVGSVMGPLLGGLLGGFFGLIALVGAIWYIWHRRHDIFCRGGGSASQVPVPPATAKEAKQIDRPYSPRRQSVPSLPPPMQPYQYGVVGRPRSSLSGPTPPHTPSPTPLRSHSSSMLTSYSRPPSSFTFNMPTSPTPLSGAGTAISPVSSLLSSRPSTPSMSYPPQLQQYRHELQHQQQVQTRVSWPRYGESSSEESHDERQRSPVLRPRSERRQSKLSLTLANWNPETDGDADMMRENEANDGEGTVRARRGDASESVVQSPDVSIEEDLSPGTG